MFARVLLVLVLAGGVADAEEPDLKWVDAVAARQPTKKQLEDDLKNARVALNSAKKAKVTGSNNLTAKNGEPFYLEFSTKEFKLTAIANWEKTVATREARLTKPSDVPSLPLERPKLLDGGTLWEDRLRVVQVIDSKNVIVKIGHGNENREEYTIWLEVETGGWSDGALREFKQPIVFTGSKQYETVAGSSKTLLVARPWNEAEIKRFKGQPRENSTK